MFTETFIFISGTESSTLWQPATVPIPDIYIPNILRTDDDTDFTQAATDCLSVLNEDIFTELCTNVNSSLQDHLLEACIRDYVVLGSKNATNVMLLTLIFYCQGVLDVNECSLPGFFDFCRPVVEPDDGFMWWIIVIIVVLLIILIIVIVIVICKKKQKKKCLIDDTSGIYPLSYRGAYFHPGHESETSFVEGISSSGWSRRRGSVDSLDSHFFESPVMFLGAPPDRFVYKDQAKRTTTSMSIDINVAPTPEPEQIDNRSVTPAFQTFKKRKRSSSLDTNPAPTEVSHLPAPLNISVSRPKPQNILGDRRITLPQHDAKPDHPPPNIMPLMDRENETIHSQAWPTGGINRLDHSVSKLAKTQGQNDTLVYPSVSSIGKQDLSMPASPNNSVQKLAPPADPKIRSSETVPKLMLPSQGQNDSLTLPSRSSETETHHASLPTEFHGSIQEQDSLARPNESMVETVPKSMKPATTTQRQIWPTAGVDRVSHSVSTPSWKDTLASHSGSNNTETRHVSLPAGPDSSALKQSRTVDPNGSVEETAPKVMLPTHPAPRSGHLFSKVSPTPGQNDTLSSFSGSNNETHGMSLPTGPDSAVWKQSQTADPNGSVEETAPRLMLPTHPAPKSGHLFSKVSPTPDPALHLGSNNTETRRVSLPIGPDSSVWKQSRTADPSGSVKETAPKLMLPTHSAPKSGHLFSKVSPTPGQKDTLSSLSGSNNNETHHTSLPTGPDSSVHKLMSLPSSSEGVDGQTAKPNLSSYPVPRLQNMTPDAPTPKPQYAPNAPHSLRSGARETSSPWKAKGNNPPLSGPSSLTTRILRNSQKYHSASTSDPNSTDQHQN